MSETTRNENNYVGYEYREVTVRRGSEALYADNFESFGWKLEGTAASLTPTSITLKFKRDRTIPNKTELTRLQRDFENRVKAIEKLEDSKVIAPSAAAYAIGLVGTALMAGAVFSHLASMIPLTVILAIPGFAGIAASYFVFNKIKASKTENVTPMIDSEYDAIYETCEKAAAFIRA